MTKSELNYLNNCLTCGLVVMRQGFMGKFSRVAAIRCGLYEDLAEIRVVQDDYIDPWDAEFSDFHVFAPVGAPFHLQRGD